MPDERVWLVEAEGKKCWEVKTARESEVYHRPVDEKRTPKGSWRPGLPPIQSLEALPESLREVLRLFASSSAEDNSC